MNDASQADQSGNPVARQEQSSSPRHSPTSAPARLQIAGIGIDNLSQTEALHHIEGLLLQGGTHYMAVVNAAKLVAATRDARLRKILLDADLVTADGMSVVWASKGLGQPLKERVTGIDLFAKLVARAAACGWSAYFFGAQQHVVQRLVNQLTRQHPDLQVAGYRNGYFSPTEAQAIAEAIKESRADLLFVALGSPAQEYWISAHLAQTAVKFALGVGGSFDHLSGLATRAPLWMQRSGLEWLHRLLQEPTRLWRRYLIGNAAFIWLVIKQIFTRK